MSETEQKSSIDHSPMNDNNDNNNLNNNLNNNNEDIQTTTEITFTEDIDDDSIEEIDLPKQNQSDQNSHNPKPPRKSKSRFGLYGNNKNRNSATHQESNSDNFNHSNESNRNNENNQTSENQITLKEKRTTIRFKKSDDQTQKSSSNFDFTSLNDSNQPTIPFEEKTEKTENVPSKETKKEKGKNVFDRLKRNSKSDSEKQTSPRSKEHKEDKEHKEHKEHKEMKEISTDKEMTQSTDVNMTQSQRFHFSIHSMKLTKETDEERKKRKEIARQEKEANETLKRNVEWFQLMQKIAHGNEKQQIKAMNEIYSKVAVVKKEILAKHINPMRKLIEEGKSPYEQWKACLKYLENLAGIVEIVNFYNASAKYEEDTEIPVYETQIEVLENILKQISKRNTKENNENKNKGENDEMKGKKDVTENEENKLKLAMSIGSIDNYLIVEQCDGKPKVTESKYQIASEEYVSKQEVSLQLKSLKNQIAAYKSFFDEMTSFTKSIETQNDEMKEIKQKIIFEEDPNKMKQNAINLIVLLNNDYFEKINKAKQEIEEQMKQQYTNEIDYFGDQLVQYEELLRENNIKMKQIEENHKKEIESTEQTFTKTLINDAKQIQQIKDEKEQLNETIKHQRNLIRIIQETAYTNELNYKKEKYPYIYSHSFKTFSSNSKRCDCFTINRSKLKDETKIVLPIYVISEGTETGAIEEIEFDLNKTEKDETNDKNVIGYFKEQGSKMFSEKSLIESNNIDNSDETKHTFDFKRYDVQIVETNLSNDIDEFEQIIESIRTNENNEMNENQYKEQILTIPLKNVMFGCEYMIFIEGKQYTVQIQKSIEENTLISVDEKLSFRIQYEQNNIYKRIGNDLHGYFTYDKQYENQSCPPQYINEGVLENETIALIENEDQVIEGYGFVDNETQERGNYIVHVTFGDSNN